MGQGFVTKLSVIHFYMRNLAFPTAGKTSLRAPFCSIGIRRDCCDGLVSKTDEILGPRLKMAGTFGLIASPLIWQIRATRAMVLSLESAHHHSACVLFPLCRLIRAGLISVTLLGHQSPGWTESDFDGNSHLPFPTPAIGVNYYDLFVRQLQPSAPAGVPDKFRWLATRHVAFVRFSAGGYWPVDWGLYQTNRAEHWRRMDGIVRAAETNHIGLVPSLFWMWSTVPDLVDEPMRAWGDTNSQTIRFMREYTREMVTRYAKSPAIWMWEFGNEYNLNADLPNAAEHRPPIVPSMGTPKERSEQDDVTHKMVRTALREFALEVRQNDKRHPITSGNAFPRVSAWHQQHEHSWTHDTEEQFAEMLAADNPDPINVISLRLYTDEDVSRIEQAAQAARKLSKPIFIGEFGVPGGDTLTNRERFSRWQKLIAEKNIPLAALWVFDFDAQNGEWNVTPDNDRAWQLEALHFGAHSH